jgi:hypothetical protein
LWLAALTYHDAGWPTVLAPFALLGIANACLWSPLSVSATRNLPARQAGAGSGVYNTTRQIGAVLGSAAIAATIASQLSDRLPGTAGSASSLTVSGAGLPAQLHPAFSQAMGASLVLPAAVLVIGLVAALFMAAPEIRRTPTGPLEKVPAANE